MTKKQTWEERFDEFGELWTKVDDTLYKAQTGMSLQGKPIIISQEAIKSFLQKAISQTEKAFGGCKNCYGKGYHTTIEYASGQGEWDMGQGDIKIHYQLPEMRFCNCDRGIELKKRFDATQKEAYEKGRLETIKEIEEKLPEKIITVFTIPMQTWRKGGFNDCLKEVQSILNQLKDNE